jgi:hypothetical protein
MKPLALAIGLFGAVTLSNVCHAQVLDNPFSEYVERGVTINPGTGNAKDANAAIHTIDPWPLAAGDTRIPGNGRSVICALTKMYRNPDPFFSILQAGGTGSTTGGSGTSSSSGSPAISMTTNNVSGGSNEGPSEQSGCY